MEEPFVRPRSSPNGAPPEIGSRILWLVGLRWSALLIALISVFALSYLGMLPRLDPIVLVLVLLGFLNLLVYFAVRHGGLEGRPASRSAVFIQLLGDMGGILALVHFTGGVASPLLFFLAGPVLAAGIFFRPRWTYLAASFALTLAFILGYLEIHDVLPATGYALTRNPEPLRPAAFMAWMACLGTLLFASAYLVRRLAAGIERREEYLSRLRKDLKHTEQDLARRLEGQRKALTGLAAGVSSDISEPLGIIRARTDAMRYLLEDLRRGEGDLPGAPRNDLALFAADLEVIAGRVDQIRDSVDRVSAFLGRSRERHGVDPLRVLKPLVEEIAAKAAPGELRVRARFEVSDVRLQGSEAEIRLLFGATLMNAVEALEGREQGRLSIQVRTFGLDGRALLVRIRDNGPGIPPNVLKHVFDPFYSTRGGDRGMGLALARTVARDHGGELRIRSRPPPGTSVSIVLPLAGAEDAAVGGEDAEASPAEYEAAPIALNRFRSSRIDKSGNPL